MGDSIPGFRFYPTEEELISFYLHSKLEGIREEVMDLVIPVLNIYDFAPSHLAQYSGVRCRGDPEQCFFFIPRQEGEVRGGRPSRLTETGYWKATGSPSYIYSSNNRIIGLKRTMVFYLGRAPQGQKTLWKMNEYKAIQGQSSSSSGAINPTLRQEFSLCRVYRKTKCLRAFDRRPTGVEFVISDTNPTINFDYQQVNQNQGSENHDNTNHDHDHDDRAVGVLSRAPPPPAAVEGTSSQEGSTTTSSIGDGRGGPSQMASEDDAFDWVESLENSWHFCS